MFAFLAPLAGMLTAICGSMVGRALLALGMGFVTYKGADTSINWLLTQIKNNIAALDPAIVQFLAFLWVDKAISVMFAAYTSAALIRMAGGSTITKLVTKGGS
jgi:hypothetical protein